MSAPPHTNGAPRQVWMPDVLFYTGSLIPLALACCGEQFRLSDPDSGEADPDGFAACVTHAVDQHHLPRGAVIQFIIGLPMLVLEMHLQPQDGDEEEDA